jgi:rhamnogalacturonyl hydrolase YesR
MVVGMAAPAPLHPATGLDAVAIRAAGERIAARVAASVTDAGHAYTRDLAMVALLDFAAATGAQRWRTVVADEAARRGWAAGFAVSWRVEPFGSLSWAWLQATGDARARAAFVAESADMRRVLERTPDGLVTHPRGAARGGGVAVLLDSFQEYACRIARAGAVCGEPAFFSDCADQVLRHRDLLRDPDTGLWRQGRGWLGHAPGLLSPGTWSRGQGWLLRGLAAAAQAIPATADEHAMVKDVLVDAVDAACAHQQPSGMWHALPHRPAGASAPESSGTGLIAAAILDSVRTGLLPAEPYRAKALRAVAALLPCVDGTGVVHAACPGPGPLEDETPWLAPAFAPGDPHGPGTVLAALAAALR